MADAIPVGQDPEKLKAKKKAARKAPTTADRVDALEQKMDKLIELMSSKMAAPVVEEPKVDPEEARVVAIGDPEAIIRFVAEKAAKEGWGEDQRKAYQNDLLRAALNRNVHDPDGDRKMVEDSKVKRVEKLTLPNPRPGSTDTFDVTVLHR